MACLKKLGFPYVKVLGDGASKKFQKFESLNVYGEQNPFKRNVCIYHVGNRRGTVLRKLVENEKKESCNTFRLKHIRKHISTKELR